MIGIYKITSPSGRVYIGQSRNINNRISSYRNIRCNKQPKLLASLQKHGWQTHKFEVVYELPSDVEQTTINQYETLYWQFYLDCGFEMLNTREPGSKGRFDKHSIEKREKSRKKSGNAARSLETRRRIGKANIGKSKQPRTLEHKEKLSKALKGRIKGKQSEVTKQRRAETRQTRKSGMKRVLHIESNVIYNSRKEAAEAFNWTPENINHYVKKGIFKYI
jgi:group I intron endonuclease